jgi:SAM-dependent methyltransferase
MGEIFARPAPDSPLPFTGERLTTALGGQTEIEHLHRYFFARSLCRGKRVLDVASGEGYGTALLAQVATEAIGVELSHEAVAHAAMAYQRENLCFLQGDGHAIPLGDAVVDVVVSFETIEHFDRQELFLSEVRRVLRPDGMVIMSTPDRDNYSPTGAPANPFHVMELTAEEFTGLLLRRFPHVQCLLQRPMIGSVLVPTAEASASEALCFENRGRSYFEGSQGLARPQYVIAVAAAVPLPPLPFGVYIETGDLAGREAATLALGAATAEARLVETRHIADEARTELEAMAQLLAAAKVECDDALRTAAALHAERETALHEAAASRAERDAALEEATAMRAEADRTLRRASTLEQVNDALRGTTENSARRATAAEDRVDALLSSTSWRLTRPVRTLRHPGRLTPARRWRRDRDLIATSGLFNADLYRATYLHGSIWARRPFVHYLWFGEKRGYRPNPFFDPRYYAKQLAQQGIRPTGSLLGFYAEHGAARDEAPSREFEHRWYRWQNPDARGHSLSHYLKSGFAELRDPAPGINLRHFLSAAGSQSGDGLAVLMRQLADGNQLQGDGIIYDFDELRERQQAFRSRLNYQVIRRAEEPRSRDLVFLQSGRATQRRYISMGRRFDVLRNYYEDPGDQVCEASEHVIWQRGTKATAIAATLERDPELLTAYEQIFFVDDDIDMSCEDVNHFFDVMRQQQLALAQPLLSQQSSCAWPIFKDQRFVGRVVPMTSVEVMMPAMSSAVLRQVAWTFKEAISGFGIDLLWGHLLDEARDTGRIAIVGEVVATHEKAIDDVNGNFYRYMTDSGINPKFELWAILQRHGVVADFRPLTALLSCHSRSSV